MGVKSRIITSATHQFLTYGVKSVTMDEIANHLGMSKRTIYENFANKRELLSACIDYIHQQKEKEQEALRSQCPTILHELVTLFHKIDVEFERQEKFTLAIKKFYPDLFEEKYQCYYEEGEQKLRARLEEGIRQGVILPSINVDFAIYTIYETLNSVVNHQTRVVKIKVPVMKAFKHVTFYLLRGFATDEGIRILDSLNYNGND